MSERIERRFAELRRRSAGLITFLCAGDPDPATSAEILAGLPAAGADVIEIGMPFSDPMADGPTIQAGSLRALKAGMTLARTLDLVRELRRRDQDHAGRAHGLQPDLALRPRAVPRRRARGGRGRADRGRPAARGGRRAVRAGARPRPALHPPGDADHRRPPPAQGARQRRRLSVLRLDHRDHRDQGAGRRAGRRGGRAAAPAQRAAGRGRASARPRRPRRSRASPMPRWSARPWSRTSPTRSIERPRAARPRREPARPGRRARRGRAHARNGTP